MEKSGGEVGGGCPKPMKATSNGVFQGENPLDHALPLAILQICIVVLLTRLLAYLLKPLRQPRVIAEIIGGVLLGPSALGRNKKYLHTIFPPTSLTVLDTLANLGLLFFLFLVGLELDLASLRRTGKKTLTIAIAGISLPFLMGIATSFALRDTISKGVNGPAFIIFMGVSLSITAFPVLARILAELKLLTTDVGRLAMAAAAVNDMAAWILLALAIALSGSTTSPLVTLWVFLCGSAFVLLCSAVIPVVFRWMERRCTAGEPVKEGYVCMTLVVVLAAGLVTDAIGIHALFGAFVVGVLMPKDGPFTGALVEKVEDVVSGIFLPLYFVSSGLKTNVATIKGVQSWGLLVLVIFTACFGKIVSTVVVSLCCKVQFSEALALGFLMNTKGLVELIVLNIGKDRKVLNDQTFAILVLMALFTTFITTPLVIAVYKPAKRAGKSGYKYRTIEGHDSSAQLRLLVCFHSSANIPTTINLVEMSRGTERNKQGLVVYAMHLMEMSERPSAILMVHNARKNGLPFWNKSTRSDSTTMVVAFDTFHRLSHVYVRPMTAISSFSTIHEDICVSAERKRAAMIILPFHKHKRHDGGMETTRGELEWVNRRVMEDAPCSVGLLVDRGGLLDTKTNPSSQVTLLFFGGPDDREALSYASRMSDHPGIRLRLLRFLSRPSPPPSSCDPLLYAFICNSAADDSVLYQEKLVTTHSEVVTAFKEMAMGDSQSHLFVVGRTPEGDAAHLVSSACSGHARNCPELGPVGAFLVEMDMSASVLVIQQYRGPPFVSSTNPSTHRELPTK